MAGADSPDSPLEAAAGAAGADATEAFELLSNDTRLAILLALWEAYDPHAAENAVPFSALRERVGTRDSGQFNYHLGKLEGQYVTKTESGYLLRPEGLKLVGTVIAGTGRGATLEPTEIDIECNLCGAPTAITYDGGWLFHICTDCEGGLGGMEGYPRGALFGEPFPPAALDGRSPEEIFVAGVFRLLQVITMKLGGLCPRCSGVIVQTVAVCEDHDGSPGAPCPACDYASAIRINWVCSVCKYRGGSSPASAMIMHPVVVAFYQAHDVDVGFDINDFDRAREVLTLMRNHDQVVKSTDPLRVEVTVSYGGDELHLTLDEAMEVIDVTRSG